MSMKQYVTVATLAAVTGLGASIASAQITIPTVRVGNPGNAADPATGDVYGSVASSYNIGATEVTNRQYAAFLNATARVGSNDLYDIQMSGGQFGGITRSGPVNAQTYATVGGREDWPVNFVDFWAAARFANWLHNGQPTGGRFGNTTEDGAYTITDSAILNNSISRNANWTWAVASRDEWHKAAYHQPAIAGGDADGYWRYPTASNSISATDVNSIEASIFRPTAVGSFNIPSYYGTFDQGGNVWEWTEERAGNGRAILGGSFNFFHSATQAGAVSGTSSTTRFSYLGFRVVQVPAPGSAAVLALAGTLAVRRRRAAV